MPVTEQLKYALQSVLTSFTDSTDVKEHCFKLHQLLLALWKTKWEATENHTIHDPTMCFLALFSLERSGGFVGPKKTTGPIAKLCWGIKLCMLAQIHMLVCSGECKDQLEAFEMIAPFIIEHELTTFHHLRSLTHYATTLAFGTMEAPSIIWTDREDCREMLYLGKRISLERLQKVKYGDLSDNLANTNPGYSFITNPLNPFAVHRHSFIKAVQKKPHLAEYFVYKAPNVADVQLNMDSSRTWLCDPAEFEGLVMVYNEFTPGALIRWTELASLLMKNTQYRLRNAMAVGKFVALVRQYDKTTNTGQKDRFIPHAASGLVADLLIQLHTFARPFAQFLASRVFPDDPAVVGMYGDLVFMDFGKQFTTDKLSTIMGEWTAPVLGWSMTVQPYRQINTVFRRKHCCNTVDEQDDEDVASMMQVLQAGHSKPVDSMHYGLSHNALLGITNEVMFAFLEGSVSWQKVLEVVPGGLALPYYHATRKHFASLALNGKVKKALKAVEGDPSVGRLLAYLIEGQHKMAKSQEAMLAQIKRMEQALHSYHPGPAQQAQSLLSHLLAPVPLAQAPLAHLLTPAQSQDTPMDGIIRGESPSDPIDLTLKAIAELNAQRLVLRYVFDEFYHYQVDEDFRKDAFQDPFELREIELQVVLMSATSPPAARAYLAQQFLLVNPLCISSPSDRRELVTRILDPCKNFKEQLAAAQQVIAKCMGNKTCG
ncbi:hypothetical protein B0H13DRAFT_1904501 [Mycena leptocephala]|nr:hypothetical protein B0H13DRAFT_1904501 [Mycena leptocephala]